MNERLKKIAPYAGYPLLYVVCLVAFASWTFPYEKLRDRILVAFQSSQRPGAAASQLEIGSVGSSWLTGIKVTDVKLTSPSSDPDGKPSELMVDEAVVRVSLLPLLIGKRKVTFDASMLGGELSGSFSISSKERTLDLEFDSLGLAGVGPITQALGVPVDGKLNGSVTMVLPDGKASKATGSIAFDVKEMSVGDGKAKLKGALALPKVDVGNLTITGEAKEGALKLTKLSADGKDVELDGQGRVGLRENATDDTLDVSLKFKISDSYRSKNDVTKSLFGAPGSSAPALFDMDPKVKKSKRSDGFYAWNIRGTLGRPDPQPAPGGGGGGR